MRFGTYLGTMLGLTGAFIGLQAGAANAGASGAAEQAVTQRKASFRMSAVTFNALKAMGESGDISKAGFPASGIALWAKALPGAFPAGSDLAASDALPAVWSDRAGFEAAAGAYQAATARLQAAAAAGDLNGFRAAIEETGKSCGGCHDSYRKEQKK